METHTLDLSEEEQLQIALALSADEQQLSSTAAEDERLARQLQVGGMMAGRDGGDASPGRAHNNGVYACRSVAAI